MEKIVIGICTYYRNELLNLCIDRILSMNDGGGGKLLSGSENDISVIKDECKPFAVEVVVVDNSPEMTAKELIDKKNVTANLKIHYFSHLGKGIASVRNRVLKESMALNPDYIAFIDDDEYPDENWIFNAYKAFAKYNADVVTGPSILRFVDSKLNELKVPGWIKNNSRFKFKRTRRQSGFLCKTAATNNVMIKAEVLRKMGFWFDESYKKMTGEDVDFFGRVYDLGYRIVWCKEAVVYGIADITRCNWKYIWRRNYNNGYLKIFSKKKNGKFNIINGIMVFLNLFIFTLIFPFSIVLGLTIFFEAFGKLAFCCGALVSLFKKDAIVHYK